MAENLTYRHDPSKGQKIVTNFSTTFVEFVGGKMVPAPEYYGHDSNGMIYGPFLTRGACDFVLGVEHQIRGSRESRFSHRGAE